MVKAVVTVDPSDNLYLVGLHKNGESTPLIGGHGGYFIEDLPDGGCDISVAGSGLNTPTISVTLTTEGPKKHKKVRTAKVRQNGTTGGLYFFRLKDGVVQNGEPVA